MIKTSYIFTGTSQRLLVNEEPSFACIYSGGKDCPEGCNVETITLDASASSKLDWDEEIKRANGLVEKGLWILWELKFNLYEGSLVDEARLTALKMGVKHFSQSIWPHFQSFTFGVILYRGLLDFSKDFPWTLEDEEFYQKECSIKGEDSLLAALYCRTTVMNYLKFLAVSLPEGCQCFLLLDTSPVEDALSYFRLTSQEAFGYFRLILKGSYPQKYPYALPAFAWDHGASCFGFFSETIQPRSWEKEIRLGLCLPTETEWEKVRKTIAALTLPFIVLPEKRLIYEWEAIEDLIVFSEGVSQLTKRKLLGFCAAEGRVITVGEPLHLPNEILFDRFQS